MGDYLRHLVGGTSCPAQCPNESCRLYRYDEYKNHHPFACGNNWPEIMVEWEPQPECEECPFTHPAVEWVDTSDYDEAREVIEDFEKIYNAIDGVHPDAQFAEAMRIYCEG